MESLSELLGAISSCYKDYAPKILYIFINKKNNTRFFKAANHENPEEGTVVKTEIVGNDGDNEFDFYMVANKNPRMASALPVHYEVSYNSTKLLKDEIIEMTYHQCYNYYGFGGPIKVPATAFYA